MHRKADRFDAGEFSRQTVCGCSLVQFYAEFVLFPARRDLDVGVGIDIRVDRIPTRATRPCALAISLRRRSSGSDSTLI